MQVAVIGGGVVGVCTAHFLAAAGHDVAVIERQANVAEQASFGNAGIVAPGYAAPWASPGMPKKILSYLFKSESPVLFKSAMDRALLRWLRMWLSECELDRYRINKQRMQRVAFYSHEVLHGLRQQYQLEYEQTRGYLQLFRTERDIQLSQPGLDLLVEHGVPHEVVNAEGARAVEPALATGTDFAGGLYLPQDESGNCPLFTKQLKYIAQSAGVEFYFNSLVTAIHREGSGVALQIDDKKFHADAVVLAAGAVSADLLAPLGIRIPLYPVKGYSATAPIKNFDEAPLAALMDESYKVAITRMGNRIRISGMAELGSQDMELRKAAMRTLIKVGDDWFPHAANYNTANFWCGTRPMLPDGTPLLGATPIRNIFVNLGHSSDGWAMAAGSGKLLADIVSGREPDIDMNGLTLGRFA